MREQLEVVMVNFRWPSFWGFHSKQYGYFTGDIDDEKFFKLVKDGVRIFAAGFTIEADVEMQTYRATIRNVKWIGILNARTVRNSLS